MNKILIANSIQVITFIASLWVITFINRRKTTIGWIIICFIDCIPYFLLNAWWGIFGSAYYSIIKIITLIIHKEEKIVQPLWETMLLSSGYLIGGVIFSRYYGNWWYLGLGAVNFFNAQLLVLKKDTHKTIADGLFDVAYIIYDLAYMNYISALRYFIEMCIYGSNLYRLWKNKESKYYKDKTNVVD